MALLVQKGLSLTSSRRMQEKPLHKKTYKNQHFFESSAYLKIYNEAKEHIFNDSALICLTGESGVGKTLISHKILTEINHKKQVVFIDDPRSSITEIINTCYQQTGIVTTDIENTYDNEHYFKRFYEYLQQQINHKLPIILCIDDAHIASPETLYNLLKLLQKTNDDVTPIQLMLVGLPELKSLLQSSKFTESNIPIPVFLSFNPIESKEIRGFINHLLIETDFESEHLSQTVIDRIEMYTQGTPGQIHMLLDSILVILEPNLKKQISVETVDEVVNYFSPPWAIENKMIYSNSVEMKNKQPWNAEYLMPDIAFDKENNLFTGMKNKLMDLFTHKQHDENKKKSDPEKSEFVSHADSGIKNVEIDLNDNSNIQKVAIEPLLENQTTLQIKPMNTQEETNTRGGRLTKVLKTMQSSSPDVEAVALISEDGLIIASALPQDLDEIRVGGMSATILSLGTRSSAELRRGTVKEIIVRGEQGYTVLQHAGRGMLLLVVANENAKLGLIFFDMHETIEKINDVL